MCIAGLIACQSAPPDESELEGESRDAAMEAPTSEMEPAAPVPPRDEDNDGLCDRTERQLATSPDVADSDGDGLPDLIEASSGFEPSNATVPAEDQVAHLLAEPGAVLDFPVHVTVEGDGTALTGHLEPSGSVYGDGRSARDFVVSTTAIEANPVDGVRRIEPGSARFTGVLGRTRLSFSVRFEYPEHFDAPACALGYPLRYELKSEDGSMVADRLFMLLVAPPSADDSADAFCVPQRCQ